MLKDDFLSDSFSTPDRHEVSDEMDKVSTQLDAERGRENFLDFMDLAEAAGFSSAEAVAVLRGAENDLAVAFQAVEGIAAERRNDHDPSVIAWHSAAMVGGQVLAGSVSLNTSEV